MSEDCRECQFCGGLGSYSQQKARSWWRRLLRRPEYPVVKHRLIECWRFPRRYSFLVEWNGTYSCGEFVAGPNPHHTPEGPEKTG